MKSCEYKDEDEILRDIFVFGLRDNGPGGVMERLFREEDVTLERAVEMARASEVSRVQMKILHERTKTLPTEPVNAIQLKQHVNSKKKPFIRKRQS